MSSFSVEDKMIRCGAFAGKQRKLVLCWDDEADIYEIRSKSRSTKHSKQGTFAFQCDSVPVDVQLVRSEAFFIVFFASLHVQIYDFVRLQAINFVNAAHVEISGPVRISSDESIFLARFNDRRRVGIYALLPPTKRISLFDRNKDYKKAVQSPSGRLLVLLSGKNLLQVWDLLQNKLLYEEEGLRSTHAWSPDERFLVVCDNH